MKVILLDIEGTITPIDFVHQKLFPFAMAKIGEFVEQNFDQIQTEIADLKTEHAKDYDYKSEFDKNSPESVAGYLKFLIEVDRKSTPLKSLQGKIWQRGYESGELESAMFADVPRALEHWQTQHKRIAIYSSGSVLAQKLLFKFTDRGDLSEFISAYFDTNIGHKRESESYRKIAAELNVKAGEILFVSDVLAELEAARAAGLPTALAVRPGNALIKEDSKHRVIKTFDELE